MPLVAVAWNRWFWARMLQSRVEPLRGSPATKWIVLDSGVPSTRGGAVRHCGAGLRARCRARAEDGRRRGGRRSRVAVAGPPVALLVQAGIGEQWSQGSPSGGWITGEVRGGPFLVLAGQILGKRGGV
jgi:hypothetical protein